MRSVMPTVPMVMSKILNPDSERLLSRGMRSVYI